VQSLRILNLFEGLRNIKLCNCSIHSLGPEFRGQRAKDRNESINDLSCEKKEGETQIEAAIDPG
jgi:hypothetical protein